MRHSWLPSLEVRDEIIERHGHTARCATCWHALVALAVLLLHGNVHRKCRVAAAAAAERSLIHHACAARAVERLCPMS